MVSLRDRLGVSEVVLVALPKSAHAACRHKGPESYFRPAERNDVANDRFGRVKQNKTIVDRAKAA